MEAGILSELPAGMDSIVFTCSESTRPSASMKRDPSFRNNKTPR